MPTGSSLLVEVLRTLRALRRKPLKSTRETGNIDRLLAKLPCMDLRCLEVRVPRKHLDREAEGQPQTP